MLNRQNLFGKRDDRATTPASPVPVVDNRTPPAVPLRPATTSAGGTPTASPAGTTAGAAGAGSAGGARNEAPKAETVTGSRLIVGPDVKLKGAEILDCDTLVVEGRVEATMDSRVIHIAEHGSFCGKVGIDVAEIHGTFDGELTVRNQLLIHSTGRVNGKIRYGKILIDEGGQLSGDVQSLGAGEAKAPAVAA